MNISTNKVNTNNKRLIKKTASNVRVFPIGMRLIVLIAFIIVIAGIVITSIYILNMIFNPQF